ncbi:hypothetical protein ACTXT7_004816 [Hymenolepis weldensis]
MDPDERVTKTSRSKGKKKQNSELVPTIVREDKNGDFSSKPKTNVVFFSRHLKRTLLTERKEKDRSCEKGKEPGYENCKLNKSPRRNRKPTEDFKRIRRCSAKEERLKRGGVNVKI